ncbi:DUF624 domain-containing protein [uncultured Granulicatella sp.]|uniref:DUF624 domain-containing protein n=1 Tax=uncultured Granulicatella sp. TaxID=316089 RepID=UPI002639C0B5|nr:DUF624 domain-containing protein [uncultured Granulicatella sp.]
MQYNQDSKFWRFATLVADFILLNLLFIVLCIPVVTIGPAVSALIHTTLKLSEDENRTLVKPFWNEFKRDITKKMLLWIVYLVLIAALVYMAQFYWNFANTNADLFKIIGFMLFMLSAFILVVTIVASIIGLAMTTQYFSPIKRLVKNSYLLIIVMPVQSLIIAVVIIAATLFAIYQTVPVLSFFLLIGFAAIAYSFAPLIREIFTKIK